MIPAILFKDGYKADHLSQYPKNTTKVYSNLTHRISRMLGVDYCVVFAIQAFCQDFLVRRFNESFFNKDKEKVVAYYRRRMDAYLGKGAIQTHHIEALHDLGYLPIELKALPEGTLAPLKTPILTITNTHPDFAWLPNMLETLLSAELWHPITSATIAFEYRKKMEKYAKETSTVLDFVKWQGHDFSMRGQVGVFGAMPSGAGHLLSFTGSDTIPAIDWLEGFYDADCEKEVIAMSIPATEHSVMCLGGKDTEDETYRRLLTDVYPKGPVSVVSDTWDYFKLLTKKLPQMKQIIMQREGKLVIRPDSGDPVKIICGDWDAPMNSPQRLGTMEILWSIFGGEVNAKGYRQLDAHIGVIYGDSITLDRAEEILAKLKAMGFASTNIVFGIGSYTYQYVTRDTLGFAMKATYGEVDGQCLEIYKDPVTDGGVKKSAKGLLRVNEDLSLSECVSKEQERGGMLQTVFKNGYLENRTSLAEIRAKIDSHFI